MTDNNFAESATGKLEAIAEEQSWWRLKVAPNGRVVIPAAARAAMGLDETGVVTARMEDGVLKLTTPAVALAKLQALVRQHAGDRSLVDELLAERRAEAESE